MSKNLISAQFYKMVVVILVFLYSSSLFLCDFADITSKGKELSVNYKYKSNISNYGHGSLQYPHIHGCFFFLSPSTVKEKIILKRKRNSVIVGSSPPFLNLAKDIEDKRARIIIQNNEESKKTENLKRRSALLTVTFTLFFALFPFDLNSSFSFNFSSLLICSSAYANVNTNNYLMDSSQNSKSPVMKSTNEFLRKATSLDGINANSDGSSIPKDAQQLINKRREKLMPIVRIEKTVKEIADLIQNDYEKCTVPISDTASISTHQMMPQQNQESFFKPENYENVKKVLNNPPFTKQAFKKTFNAFSDDILLVKSNPNIAFQSTTNAPSTLQSMQYLYRNEALTNLEYLATEVNYLLEEKLKTDGNLDLEDALNYITKALEAIENYLALIDQEELSILRHQVK